MSLALADGILHEGRTVFDYGCGRGGDIRRLEGLGFAVGGWDPAFAPAAPKTEADVVNLGYVINVVEDPRERAETLRRAWDLAGSVMVVAGRMAWERQHLRGEARSDGVVTSRNTFQKFYEQDELRGWIDATLGTRSVPAAPGVFYVFRDESDAQHYLARRHRRRVSVPRVRRSEALYEQHRVTLAPLIDFVADRGRLPRVGEIDATEIEAAFGTIKTAFGIVRRVTGDEHWEALRRERSEELSIFLALAAFGGRPSFGHLSADIQADIRDFFGTYRAACDKADSLLFGAGDLTQVSAACAHAAVGKLTADALYVHVSAMERLPALLRVYDGCATALAGTVDGANVVKLNRLKPKVSYMSYPDFERMPHPALADASPVRGIPVIVRGRIIGRGMPGYVLSPDLVVSDDSGFVPLLYRQPVPFLGMWFGLARVPGLMGQDLVARGWYRRSPGPVIELRSASSGNDRTINCWEWVARFTVSSLVLFVGLVVLALGAWGA